MRLWLSVLAFCCVPLQAAEPFALVEWQGQYRGYFEAPRLAQVLEQASQPQIYWPAARLFRTDAESLAQAASQQSLVLAQLEKARAYYLADNDQAEAQAVAQLIASISQWQVGLPVPGSMDIDRVRTQLKFNPKLNAGHYKLLAGKRPTQLTVLGMVAENTYPLQQGLRASQLQLTTLPGANKDIVYVVTPADVKTVGVRFWNAETEPLAPWMTLLVGLDTDALPDELAELNTQLAILVGYRMVE
ncbi:MULTISPECIES: capsule biosynthesis GfcC D2 domain-containing protein [Rheinheimera]|uniref:Capsule biosynthesis GfcC D2 domain-containing protein n=1 Tax=Rheinheimera marina TaxID=1774958 RepID=A0ABV9JRK9_9GAMM